MAPVASPSPPPWHRVPLRRRTASFLLALAVHALLLLMLFRLAPPQSRRRVEEAQSVSLLPLATPQAAPKPAPKATRRPAGAPRRVAAARAAPAQPPPSAPPPTPAGPLDMMIVTRDAFKASDIAGLPSHRAAAQTADGAGGTGSASGAGDGSEAGPNGERLYSAEWYRKPTHAEMAPYLPAGVPVGSWGEIACRMVANYRVEDCHELDDSAPGLGLARGLRLASWQFRVLPPRVGGRQILGVWVRIRFDITEKGEN